MFRHVSAIMCLCGFVGSTFLLLILLGYTEFYFFLFLLPVFFLLSVTSFMLESYVALAMFTTIFILVHFYFQLKEQHSPTEQCALEFNSIHFDWNRSHSDTVYASQCVSYLVVIL